MNSMNIVQAERLFAAHSSLITTRKRCEELKGGHAEAKKRMNEARESLLSAISGAREKHQGDSGCIWRGEAEAIWKHEREFTRSIKAYELIDREKRRTDDLEQKLTDRVLSIIENAKNGEELPFGGEDKADPANLDSRWSEILLADLIGDLNARPFIQFASVHTLGHFVTRWDDGVLERQVREKRIDQKVIDYAGAMVRDYLVGRDLASKLGKGMENLPSPSLRDVDIKEEKPARAEKPKEPAAPTEVRNPDGSINQEATDAAIKARFDESAMPKMFAEGTEEHLNARVVELGLDEKTTLAITSAGLSTIAEIVALTEKHAGMSSVIGINTGWKPGQIKAILAAVSAFRRKHAQAARDAETPEPRRIVGVRNMGTPKAKARVGQGAGKKGRR